MNVYSRFAQFPWYFLTIWQNAPARTYDLPNDKNATGSSFRSGTLFFTFFLTAAASRSVLVTTEIDYTYVQENETPKHIHLSSFETEAEPLSAFQDDAFAQCLIHIWREDRGTCTLHLSWRCFYSILHGVHKQWLMMMIIAWLKKGQIISHYRFPSYWVVTLHLDSHWYDAEGNSNGHLFCHSSLYSPKVYIAKNLNVDSDYTTAIHWIQHSEGENEDAVSPGVLEYSQWALSMRLNVRQYQTTPTIRLPSLYNEEWQKRWPFELPSASYEWLSRRRVTTQKLGKR